MLVLALGLTAAVAAAPVRAATVVSLTFDDGQATQYRTKEPLAEHGMRGTFYINSGDVCVVFCGPDAFEMTWGQIAEMAAEGNEIGGHTLNHIDLTDPTISAEEKVRQVCEDRQNLIERGYDAVSFAYPYSHHDAAAREMVATCGYTSGRGVGGADYQPETIPPVDPLATRTPGHSSEEITLEAMKDAITRAETAGGGWVQLVFHGVCESRCNDGWVKPDTFEALLDWLEPRAASGTVVRTVREVIGGEPPETSIDGGPPTLTNDGSATFDLSANRSVPTFECSLDRAEWEPCGDVPSYTDLSDGPHTFAARARDELGLVDPTPASWTWRVDTVAPATAITAGPEGAVATSSASFEFAAEAGASFECRLDGGEWEPCLSPSGYADLGDGEHAFSVRATDTAGNTGAAVSRAWSVDTTGPETSITSGPTGTVASGSASFSFAGGDGFECKLDGGDEWKSCSSPEEYVGLADGTHAFAVRARDALGNWGPQATREWTVEAGSPQPSDPEPSDPDPVVTPPPALPPPPVQGQPSGSAQPDPDLDPDLDTDSDDPAVEEERPPAGSEGPPDPDAERGGHGWAPRALRRILRRAARANRRRAPAKVARRGVLKVKLPRRAKERGVLRVEAFLLPDPPGPAIRLARKRTAKSADARRLKLRLNRRGRRHLARLWVAAIELRATHRQPDSDVLTERRVFLMGHSRWSRGTRYPGSRRRSSPATFATVRMPYP